MALHRYYHRQYVKLIQYCNGDRIEAMSIMILLYPLHNFQNMDDDIIISTARTIAQTY